MEFQTLNLLLKCSSEFGHRRLRGCGLNETECLLCSYVSAHPGCSQETAAHALRMDKTTAAKALRGLEEKGYVERGQGTGDRRVKTLKITGLGTERISAILHLHDRWLDSVLSVLTEEEQKTFEELCVRLLHAAEMLQSGEDPKKTGG